MSKSIITMFEEEEKEKSLWDRITTWGPLGNKIKETEDKANKLAKEAELKEKEKTVWEKAKDSFTHTGNEIADFTKRNVPFVYNASKKVGETADDVGGHLGRNWAAYGTGAGAIAAGLGAYKLRQNYKKKKQKESLNV
jgi:hypothetical protein